MNKLMTLFCVAATLFGVAALANTHSGRLTFVDGAHASSELRPG